jgi:hypothetical protein
MVGKQKFKSDLIPGALLVAKYFAAGQVTIEALESALAVVEQQLEEVREEQRIEGGLLEEVGDDKGKISRKAVAARLKEIGSDGEDAEEREALVEYAALLDRPAGAKSEQDALEAAVAAKYGKLTEADMKELVVVDKWLGRIGADVQSELDRVSQALTGRIRQLAERYAVPLPRLSEEVLSPVGQDSKFLASLTNQASIVEPKARMARGDATVHISAGNLARLSGCLPEQAEQTAIAAVLSDMDAEIAAPRAAADQGPRAQAGHDAGAADRPNTPCSGRSRIAVGTWTRPHQTTGRSE